MPPVDARRRGLFGFFTVVVSITPYTVLTEFYADENVTGEVATAVGRGTGDGAVLQLQLRLHNHGDIEMELTESTRCTILRWTIIDARGNPVQTMPNRTCAQQLATRTLLSAQTIERAYQIPLPVGPGRYTVRFSFWGYPGKHAFKVR